MLDPTLDLLAIAILLAATRAAFFVATEDNHV